MYSSWQLLEDYCKEKFIRHENPIEQLMGQDFQEIMINSWNQIFLEDARGIRRLPEVFHNKEEYLRFFHLFMAKHNQRLSVDKPIVHFDIASLYRITGINEHLTQDVPILSIRKSAVKAFDEHYFLEQRFFTKAQLDWLVQAVQQRKTIFISGETSSGKTTLLNFMIKQVPAHERLLVIEDTKEVKAPEQMNVVYLRTVESVYQVKEVNTSELVKTSLRMRPDRIILGEIRRDEVVDFLHAINTGHHGSLSTGHGNTPTDMIARLELLLLENGMPHEAVKRYLGHGIDYIIQLSGKKQRRIERIAHVMYRNKEIECHDLDEVHGTYGISPAAKPLDP